MTISARPCARSMSPIITEVRPVAHAVMVAVIGPVAPVRMDIFPPTILMQELGLAQGGGSFFSSRIRRSADRTASSPPTAELKVMAVPGARSGVISMLLFSNARCTTSIAQGKMGEGHRASDRGLRKGQARISMSGT